MIWLFWLAIGAALGLFLVYMGYCVFSIIDGIFSCMGDNGSIIGWTIVIAVILFLILERKWHYG